MSSRLEISAALLVGCFGFVVAGANLPIDTQITIETKLGQRTLPYWLVSPESKILKSEGGSGLIRLFGGLLGFGGFATAMHLAGNDERQQYLFWSRKSQVDKVWGKFSETVAEINTGNQLRKLQAEAQADVDLHSLNIQQNFREAIGFVPPQVQPALPHGKPGTLDEVTNPGDKIDDSEQVKSAIEPGDSLTRTLLESSIRCVVFAGFLKLIGTPGCGKTTLTNALIRCRIGRGHRLIIINSHKRKSMYRGIEKFLVSGTKIYGTGLGDGARAKSLLAGLNKILEILSNRYDEYQNSDKGSYSHFPVTLILEEIGEWEPLLVLIFSSAEVEKILQSFWLKLFIAARKGKVFPLVTAQTDTQAMFKAKNLSELFKQSGTITLALTAVPDEDSEDGWKPSGQGKLKTPNSVAADVTIPDVRLFIKDEDFFGDCEQSPESPATDIVVDSDVEISPASTVSPPSLHPILHQLESLLYKDSTSLYPVPENWQFPDPMEALTPEVKAVVVACKRSNMPQDAAIKAVWGISKSGSDKRYEAARNHWRSVII
jgi:energy-coupling factor transporter ATP-binding protein EcfA2